MGGHTSGYSKKMKGREGPTEAASPRPILKAVGVLKEGDLQIFLKQSRPVKI